MDALKAIIKENNRLVAELKQNAIKLQSILENGENITPEIIYTVLDKWCPYGLTNYGDCCHVRARINVPL